VLEVNRVNLFLIPCNSEVHWRLCLHWRHCKN